MPIQPMTPSRAARRQLFRDRVIECLIDTGLDPDRAEARARDIQTIADELGFTLPAAIDDPPARPAASTEAGRAAARALFEETRRRNQTTADAQPVTG